MPYIYNFEWDPVKADSNLKKHAVTFEESATVFKDPNALSLFDPDHSENEDRWITLGLSEKARLLVVIHTFLEKRDGTVNIRIISSRKATKQESLTYGE
jgi:uncharacterized protein